MNKVDDEHKLEARERVFNIIQYLIDMDEAETANVDAFFQSIQHTSFALSDPEDNDYEDSEEDGEETDEVSEEENESDGITTEEVAWLKARKRRAARKEKARERAENEATGVEATEPTGRKAKKVKVAPAVKEEAEGEMEDDQ